MKRICRYQTSDGQEFENLEDARVHEILLETLGELVAEIQPAYNTDRAEAVVKSIISHAKEIRDILNKHLRRQPKTAN